MTIGIDFAASDKPMERRPHVLRDLKCAAAIDSGLQCPNRGDWTLTESGAGIALCEWHAARAVKEGSVSIPDDAIEKAKAALKGSGQ